MGQRASRSFETVTEERKNMATSTPPKPEPIRGEDGRLLYPGSLAMTTELSDDQKDQIKHKLKTDPPQTPSSLVSHVDGLNLNNPHDHESVRRHLAKLEQGGTVTQMKDENGRLLGWQAADNADAEAPGD
jgi:hypothetical protein